MDKVNKLVMNGRPEVFDDGGVTVPGGTETDASQVCWLTGKKHIDWDDGLSDGSLLTIERALNLNLQRTNADLIGQVQYLQTKLIAVPMIAFGVGGFLGVLIGWAFA